MKKSKIVKIILVALYIIALINPINTAFSQGEKADSLVPISDMTLQYHLLIFNVLIPNILTPFLIILFPLIFMPLFLFIKNKIWFQYENTYIELPRENELDVKKLVKRFIYLFLLVMGMSAMFLNMGLFGPADFLTDQQRKYWIQQQGIDNSLYIGDIFATITSLALPIAVGLWSIGWALEDCGLMHYKLPETEEKMLFEIEPVYRKYQSIVKGYAGISAILYFVSAVSYHIVRESGRIMDVLQLIGSSVMIVFIVVPSYFLYLFLIKKFLKKAARKNLKELRIITKGDVTQE